MLPLPNLDDQEFNEIVSSAKRKLKNFFPQWTDHTPHDPGITFIELLAFLKEIQQKNINRVGDESILKFLELFNIFPHNARPAVTEVVFAGHQQKKYLPKGTKLRADDLVFATTERVLLTDNFIKSILIDNMSEHLLLDCKLVDGHRVLDIFGRKPEKGNRFLLGFNNSFAAQETIKIKFNIFEDYAVKRNPLDNNDYFTPIALVKWEYYGEENGQIGWHSLQVLEDTTYSFLFSGFITFKFEGVQLRLEERNCQGLNQYCFRCTLLENGYEVSPKLKQVLLNCAVVEQKNKLCESYTFNSRQLLNSQIVLDSYLAFYGSIRVFFKKNDYWIEMSNQTFNLIRDEEKKLCWLNLSHSDLCHLADNDQEVLKIVAAENGFWANSVIGSTTGVANSTFELNLKKIIADDFELLVAEKSGENSVGWKSWQQVNSLDKVKNNDLCYRLDSTQGLIKFGDNKNGRAPEKGKDNIMIAGCSITAGSTGNIHTDKINGFYQSCQDFADLKVRQIKPAEGGQEAEKIAEAAIRMLKDLKTNRRAVTVDDFEKIIYETPGLMIKNVKVLPLYKPGMKNYPEEKDENCVTVVVEPYLEDYKFKLSEGYLKNLTYHINRHRIITTKVYLLQPEYIGLDIYGEILINSNYSNAAKLIDDRLNNYLETIQQNKLLKNLSYSDLYSEIGLLECVYYIRFLSIEPSGHRVTKTGAGDIKIPPNARIYIKNNNLVLVNNEQF